MIVGRIKNGTREKNIEQQRYNWRSKERQTLCYADDAVLIAENKDDPQPLLCKFGTMENEDICSNNDSMSTSKTLIRCKRVVDERIMHQKIKFKYLQYNTRNH